MPAQDIVPVELFAESRAKLEWLIECLSSARIFAMTHSEVERFVEVEGRELQRLMLQGHLDARGAGERIGEVRNAQGKALPHRKLHSRSLQTTFGLVEVNRLGYGNRGENSLHPLDADLKLPKERYSLLLQRHCAEEAAKNSFDDTGKTLATLTGGTIPKRQLEEVSARAAEDFDAFYAQRHEDAVKYAKTTSPILVLSMDGKGVVMRKEDLREPTRTGAEQRVHKMTKRLARGEKRNAKRIATVAAVYTIEPFHRKPEDIMREFAPIRDAAAKRPRPEDKRVWASISKAPAQIVSEMAQEAKSRDTTRKKQWVALVDGNANQLRLLKEMAVREGVALTMVLDLIHVVEYLWRASTCFCKESSKEAEQWVTERLHGILEGNASHVAAGIRRSATKRGLEDRKAADECAGYLLNHREYLEYHEYLAAGFPISTGVIEGACRHLIKDRMDLTGARWSLEGAEAILRLRSLRASGDFDVYWHFHEQQEFRRNHSCFYEDNTVPRPERTSCRPASS